MTILYLIWHVVWGSYIGRLITAGLVALALLKGYGLQQQYKGKQEVIQQSATEGKKKADESKKASDRVYSDDKYFNRRLLKYCTDCKR